MDKKEFINTYWKQYELLEKDFLKSSEYVRISKFNYSTFSDRYVRLFLAICSELDSVIGSFCEYLNEDMEKKNLYNFISKINYIIDEYPKLNQTRVVTKYPYDTINIVPFSKVSENNSTDWWHDYNEVKHRRGDKNEQGMYNYQKANLKNVLFALAALYIVCTLFYNLVSENEGELNTNIFEIQ